MIPLFVGYDAREAIAFHTFCQSVLDHTTQPVSFIPCQLKSFDGQRDGSNAFVFSRYLVPYLCDFKGWAIFADGDMVVTADIAELWDLRHEFISKALAVVKHDYKTRHPRKYMGTRMESDNVDYDRKNWSSVVLWNCSHFAHRRLDPDFVAHSDPQTLHRFSWLKDELIGELPSDWNHLVGEDPPGPAKLYHYTLGIPGIRHYTDDPASWRWHTALVNAMACAGELPCGIVNRATLRVGEEVRRAV